MSHSQFNNNVGGDSVIIDQENISNQSLINVQMINYQPIEKTFQNFSLNSYIEEQQPPQQNLGTLMLTTENDVNANMMKGQGNKMSFYGSSSNNSSFH